MLRVGLTGGLGSGKSTIGGIFAELGAAVIDADEVGRQLMQPGKAVYDQIAAHFGEQVVQPDGSLDRRALAELAFTGGRLEELNRIVHPAVIAAQEEWMRGIFARDPGAVAIVESALVFEVSGAMADRETSGSSAPGRPPVPGSTVSAPSVPGWKNRFDCIILVTAPDELKVQRFVRRSMAGPPGDPEALAADARKRLAAQIPDARKIAFSDWVIENSGDLSATRRRVEEVYSQLEAASTGRMAQESR